MKRLRALCLGLLAAVSMCVQTAGYYEPDTDYMELMLDCAAEGDVEGGKAAQKSRNEKLAETGLEYEQVDFWEMYLLAKIVEVEAGSGWLPDEWKLAVGEVVLNRVASPEFPDTIEEVIEQPGQYYGEDSSFFNQLVPSRKSAEIAARLLSGERVLNEPTVVFQANFVLGGGVFREFTDSQLGSTYLCFSSNPELYGN